MNLRGEAEEVDLEGHKEESVKRVKMTRLSELNKESKETVEENRKQKKTTEVRIAKLLT